MFGPYTSQTILVLDNLTPLAVFSYCLIHNPSLNSTQSRNMPSKTLVGIWAALDFCLFAAGVVLIVLSFMWRAPDLVRDLVISDMDLTGALPIFLQLTDIITTDR